MAAAKDVLLVFDGLKGVADIYLNNVYLGFTADQFLRYEYPVSAALLPSGDQHLTVVFPPFNDTRNANARFMACSGG